jgi:multidrug efflux pump subunit AcrA (membrane-fusion protein)
MFLSSLVLSLALAQAGDVASASRDDAGNAVIHDATLTSIQRLDVPGADPGVLVKLTVELGARVKEGQELARIDDREAQANVDVKHLDYLAAKQEADSKVEVDYQRLTAAVAQKTYEKLAAVNDKTPGAVTHIDMLKTKLEWDRAELGILRAQEKNKTDTLTARAKEAEWKVSTVGVERRILKAPFDGVVINLYKKPGEWVTAGEPVLELVRIDRLGVRGSLPSDEWTPSDIDGRNVTVEVKLPKGRVEKVRGKVVFVTPVVEAGGGFPVWAEIDAPMENQVPLIRAGMPADLTINVKEPVSPAARSVSTADPSSVPMRDKAVRPASTAPASTAPASTAPASTAPATTTRTQGGPRLPAPKK